MSNEWIFVNGPGERAGARGFSSISDPYLSNRDHRIFEIMIPVIFLGGRESFGFYAKVQDDKTKRFLEWPVGGGGVFNPYGDPAAPSPGMWGDIISVGERWIPEFPSFLALPLLISLTLIVIMVAGKTHARKEAQNGCFKQSNTERFVSRCSCSPG